MASCLTDAHFCFLSGSRFRCIRNPTFTALERKTGLPDINRDKLLNPSFFAFERKTGLEPATSSLEGWSSTN